ncbi:MAG: magnetic particle specific iron-binding protein [Rhodospirillales bacterium]
MAVNEITAAKAAAPVAQAGAGFFMPGMEIEGEAMTAKGAAATKTFAAGKAGAAKGALSAKAATVGKGAGIAKAGSGGAFLSGKGLGLGAGLGLGGWGPVIVGALGAIALYAYLKSRQTGGTDIDQSETDLEIKEALENDPEASPA